MKTIVIYIAIHRVCGYCHVRAKFLSLQTGTFVFYEIPMLIIVSI